MALYWEEIGNYSYVNMPSPLSTIRATGATFGFTIPTVQASIAGRYITNSPIYVGLGRAYTSGQGWGNSAEGLTLKYNGSSIRELRGHSTYAVQANAYANITWDTNAVFSFDTSNYFNSANRTTRSIDFSVIAPANCKVSSYYEPYNSGSSCSNSAEKVLSNITVTLDAPPTYDLSSLSIDTPYIYTGLTTASVTVSNLSAKYGGTITDVTFTIGNTSVSRADAGTLSILLDTVGTFTPTVTVTDSRGQTTTKTLDPIQVNGYVAPSVSFTADRTLASGVPDDEGTYATVDATFTFTDVVADAVAPSVVLTDENGTQTTPAVTWYSSRASDGTLSGALSDWSTLSSGDTVYGLIPNVNTQYSYQISVRPRDSQGTGTAITQTLSSAFYTVDFLAGGHGVAFGKPASATGFECAMTATFEDTLQADGTATFGSDVLIDLPDYQTASTTDKAIYDAVVALGWDSDVLIN